MPNRDIVTTEELNEDIDKIIKTNDHEEKSKAKSLISFIIEVVIWCIVIVVGINVFFRFFKFPEVHGSSMEPTYHDGEVLFAKVTTNVTHNDIVVVWAEEFDEYIIKRVIGVGGDHIEIKDGVLKRNGEIIQEDYLNEPSWGEGLDINVDVPAGTIYVMGDNRNHSADSRNIGCISVDEIYGKVLKKANWARHLIH